MADIEVELIKCPALPNTIQGDGRYVMALLKSYLEQVSVQVNLANGFSAEEINPELGDYVTPRNFYLSFSMLGGEFTWDHLYDVSNLAYYEVRTDTNVGNNAGLLERTIDNSSWSLPTNRVGTVYLYAVSKEGKVSNPSVLNYTKPYPDSPSDISITNSLEGTLITFSEIPSNCLGAYIYVAGKRFASNQNVYLFTETTEIEKVEVAYYDQFGEGEHSVLYIILPDVTGFLVERNGDELDFYWDRVNVYGAKYVVKIGKELSWEQATELFRTTTNAKNRFLYPNAGTYYIMIKAYDDNGNYSKNAAYQIMNNEPNIERNIILEFDQKDVLYNGTKINMYYDPITEGVTLDREAKKGEYIFDVQLDQEYRARNWIDYTKLSVTNSDITWDDANVAWQDFDIAWAGVIGNVDSAIFTQELATKKSEEANFLFSADLNGDIDEEGHATILEQQHCDEFVNGRWALGLKADVLTRLSYQKTLMSTFTNQFWLKVTELTDSIVMVMSGTGGKLTLSFEKDISSFVLRGSDGTEIALPIKDTSGASDYYFFAISQGVAERKMYVYQYSTETTSKGVVSARPLGVFNEIYCYAN